MGDVGDFLKVLTIIAHLLHDELYIVVFHGLAQLVLLGDGQFRGGHVEGHQLRVLLLVLLLT